MCKIRGSATLTLENGDLIRIDKCMAYVITELDRYGIKTLGCCCGHRRYPASIIIEDQLGKKRELLSGIEIERKTRFYKSDKKGFFFIPEIHKEKK